MCVIFVYVIERGEWTIYQLRTFQKVVPCYYKTDIFTKLELHHIFKFRMEYSSGKTVLVFPTYEFF